LTEAQRSLSEVFAVTTCARFSPMSLTPRESYKRSSLKAAAVEVRHKEKRQYDEELEEKKYEENAVRKH
jgi:hypothetical protein